MQRRGISADIVNPSTSERTLNTFRDSDSSFSSHNADVFNSSINKSSGLESNVIHPGLVSRTAQRIGDYASYPDHNTLPKHIQLASINLAGRVQTDQPHIHPELSQSHGMRLEKDMRGTFDNKVHGELSQTLSDLAHTLSTASSAIHATSAQSSAPSGVFSRSSGSVAASSLLTAPSSCEAFPTEPAPSASPSRPLAPPSHPTLSKESVKQYTYIDSLVDTATIITHALWPFAESTATRQVGLDTKVLSHFITETLRKSKTSWSTMQLALLYCIRFRRDQIQLARALIGKAVSAGAALETARSCLGSMCARRNFLSALILASKYLQDRNFSNKAWSKISTVPIGEINAREREFLEICQWRLDVKHDVFKDWSSTMENFITEVRDGTIFGDLESCQRKWKAILRRMVMTADVEMTTITAQLAAYAPVPSSPEQLPTPVVTPGIETRAEFVPVQDSTSTDVVAAASLVSPCQTDASVDEAHMCPFFDEFIHSSPGQISNEYEQGCQDGAAAAAAAAYGTPESITLTSPESFVTKQESVRQAKTGAQIYDYDPMLGCATVVDSQQFLLTPRSMSSESDLYISCDNDCTFSSTTTTSSSSSTNGRKRGISQVGCHDDTNSGSCNTEFLARKRRRSDGEAFSRIK